MATDDRALSDVSASARTSTYNAEQPSEYSVVKPSRRAAPLDFDSVLAPTCMVWAMFIGLGIIGITILLWIISTGLRMI